MYVMSGSKLRNRLFHRIGDQYRSFLDRDHFLGRSAFEDPWIAPPAANIKNGKEAYHLEVVLPGFRKEEISVSLDHNVLTVKAQAIPGKEKGVAIHEEVSLGEKEQRSFELTRDIVQDGITAKFDNGVLNITLPHKVNNRGSMKKKVAVS